MASTATQRTNPLVWLGIALVVSVVLMGAFGVLSMTTSGGYYGMMGNGMGWGVVFMAVPAVILILVLVLALGGLGERHSHPPYGYPGVAPPPMGAVEILNQRFARGEITREQYAQMKADLEGHPH